MVEDLPQPVVEPSMGPPVLLLVLLLVLVVDFFVFVVASQSAHGSFVWGSVGTGPKTVSVLVWNRVNVPTLSSSFQSTQARSSDG